jgi:serine phosphatase RsbU (regulator of sigma subunit)
VVENARLYEEERKLTEMKQEVRLAYEIQTNLLPSKAPTVEGYDLAGISIPAKQVGGDYFDYIPMDDGRLAVTVGDVSGKGMGAALLMSNTQATLRAQSIFGGTPGDCLGRSNRLLCQSTRRGTFVTLFLGFLNLETHEVEYANAGHNRPYIVHNDGTVEPLMLGSLVLGFLPSHQYESATYQLQPGEMLAIYSDGVTEAMNPSHDQFDEERLESILSENRHLDAHALLDLIVDRVKSFAGTQEQSDDITLLLLRRNS